MGRDVDATAYWSLVVTVEKTITIMDRQTMNKLTQGASVNNESILKQKRQQWMRIYVYICVFTDEK